ncbi:hypothetical protein KOAAANKH_01397 [Brevundimonas sp. NIBR10]|uniref:energy transducer TonB n=1 Tax=Brevundimonas sp. NIBR10 TaxID=3015997 RepID=UPI0022F1C318|nr:energy transducer TonB [Brevundimonas sp. NIBR10]WGM46526.1 hypothetical protein KOAAANKH_01397 [Brevundimonas sp. NIBR10]
MSVALFAALVLMSPPRQQDSPVSWVTPPAPTEEDYPGFASLIGVSGSVSVNCLSTVSGRVRDCQVLSATPPGLGFETAAITIVSRGLTRPASAGGVPYESRFSVRVPFQMWEDDVEDEPRPERPDVPTPTESALRLAERVVDAYGAGPMIEVAVDGLPLAKHEEVQNWARRDMVQSDRQVKAAVTRMVALALTEEQMSEILEGGAVAVGGRQDVYDLGNYLMWDVDVGAYLKDRYCSRYEC